MLEKSKTDKVLGEQIQGLLEGIGLHTPAVYRQNPLTDGEKISYIEDQIRKILDVLGFDLNDDSMRDTPERVAKMMVLEQFWGMATENFPKMTTFEKKRCEYDQMVLERDIPFVSQCAHHLQAIIGKATIAYIPNGRIVGLSKLNRLVEYFSRRPQTQETLTEQIQKSLQYVLETDNVAVSLTATHNCVACRGVGHFGCSTTTNAFGGAFLATPVVREELLKFL